MADDENPDVKSAGGEDVPASKKKVGKKNVVKNAAQKKRAKKITAEKISVKKRIAVKKVVKKGPPKRSAPAAALAHAAEPKVTVSATKPSVSAGQEGVQQHLKEMDKRERGEISVTSTSESSQLAATHRFWPKVILWFIVILVGFMVVRPFANKDAAEEQTEMAAPVVEQQAPAAPAAEAAVAGKPSNVHALREPEVYAEETSEPASPVPAAPAPELMAPQQAAAAEPAPAAVAPSTPATVAARWKDPAVHSAGSRRSQLMGEYEARRKTAWENSRRRHERMRRPMPPPWGGGHGQRPYYVSPYQLPSQVLARVKHDCQ